MGATENGRAPDKTDSLKGEPMEREGIVLRVDRFLGFIYSTGTQYAFTLDKLEGYRGEQLREFGLYEGCSVRFTVAHDGLSVKNVFISSGRQAQR